MGVVAVVVGVVLLVFVVVVVFLVQLVLVLAPKLVQVVGAVCFLL